MSSEHIYPLCYVCSYFSDIYIHKNITPATLKLSIGSLFTQQMSRNKSPCTDEERIIKNTEPSLVRVPVSYCPCLPCLWLSDWRLICNPRLFPYTLHQLGCSSAGGERRPATIPQVHFKRKEALLKNTGSFRSDGVRWNPQTPTEVVLGESPKSSISPRSDNIRRSLRWERDNYSMEKY